MLAACEAALPADVLVMAAAVADWRPDFAANSKIEEDHRPRRAADQAGGRSRHTGELGGAYRRPRLVIGFAAETDDVVQNAVAKRSAQGRGLDHRQ